MPTFDQLLVRFAALIAATELEVVRMPAAVRPGPARRRHQANAKNRKTVQQKRDDIFRTTAEQRIAAAPPRDREFRSNPDPDTEASLRPADGADYLFHPRGRIPDLARVVARNSGTPRQAPQATGPPTSQPALRGRHADRGPVETDGAVRDRSGPRARGAEAVRGVSTRKSTRPNSGCRSSGSATRPSKRGSRGPCRYYPAVKIIPEPYGRTELEADLKTVYADPAQAPRDPAEKKAAQTDGRGMARENGDRRGGRVRCESRGAGTARGPPSERSG